VGLNFLLVEIDPGFLKFFFNLFPFELEGRASFEASTYVDIETAV
jgi:hypothetical protein